MESIINWIGSVLWKNIVTSIQHLNFKRKHWNGETKAHPIEETSVPKNMVKNFQFLADGWFRSYS